MDECRRTLKKGDLEVVLCLPGKVFHGARFSWSGVFEQIEYKGHTFCSVELPEGMEGPTTDGFGMMSEINAAKPLGFVPDQLGRLFPKLGVGSLLNDKMGPYDFMHPYPVAEPCTFTVESTGDSAVITTVQPPCQGFAMTMVKKICLSENSISMTTTLTNTGSEAISAAEYNHNFMLIDHYPLGPGYELTLPKRIEGNPRLQPCMQAKDNKLFFPQTPEVFFIPMTDVGDVNPRWELVQHAAHAGIRETGGGTVRDVNLWGKAYVISAEAFLPVEAQPGQQISWQRNWEFFTL